MPYYTPTEEVLEKITVEAEAFDYSTVDSLALFEGTHPSVLNVRMKRMNWDFKFDISKKQFILRYKITHWIETLTGWRIGEYRNYRLLK